MTKAWAFMRRFKIHGVDGSLYLDRLRVIETPWFGVYLHAIHRPDHDQEHHDHPWSFLSLILRGEYEESQRMGPEHGRYVRCRWLSFHRAEDAHRIALLSRSPVWTLVLRGPRRREWGFYTDRGWVDWRTFLGVTE